MRAWRHRNPKKVREYERNPLRRQRRKEAAVRRATVAATAGPVRCGFPHCNKPAVTTVERIDPRTWQTIQVPYCGRC